MTYLCLCSPATLTGNCVFCSQELAAAALATSCVNVLGKSGGDSLPIKGKVQLSWLALVRDVGASLFQWKAIPSTKHTVPPSEHQLAFTLRLIPRSLPLLSLRC